MRIVDLASVCVIAQEVWQMRYGHGPPLLLPEQLCWQEQLEVLPPLPHLAAPGSYVHHGHCLVPIVPKMG